MYYTTYNYKTSNRDLSDKPLLAVPIPKVPGLFGEALGLCSTIHPPTIEA